jgi:hypothetical protein
MLCAAVCVASCIKEETTPTLIDCYIIDSHSGEYIEGIPVLIYDGATGHWEAGQTDEDHGELFFTKYTDENGHFQVDMKYKHYTALVEQSQCYELQGTALSTQRDGVYTLKVNPIAYVNFSITDDPSIVESYDHIVMLGPVMSDGSCGELEPTLTFDPANPDTTLMVIMPGIFDVAYECYTHKGEMVYKQFELHIPKCDTVLFAMPF